MKSNVIYLNEYWNRGKHKYPSRKAEAEDNMRYNKIYAAVTKAAEALCSLLLIGSFMVGAIIMTAFA